MEFCLDVNDGISMIFKWYERDGMEEEEEGNNNFLCSVSRVCSVLFLPPSLFSFSVHADRRRRCSCLSEWVSSKLQQARQARQASKSHSPACSKVIDLSLRFFWLDSLTHTQNWTERDFSSRLQFSFARSLHERDSRETTETGRHSIELNRWMDVCKN